MNYTVAISYEVPCLFYYMDIDTGKKYKEPIDLCEQMLENIYTSIKEYRSRYPKTGDMLSDVELRDRFISDDYGLVHIKQETIHFNYDKDSQRKGTLRVSCEFLINIESETTFTLENIEGLIFNAINSTYSEDGKVIVMHNGIGYYWIDYCFPQMILELRETPQNINYSVQQN